MRVFVLRVPLADAELASDRLWLAGAAAIEERDVAGGDIELRTILADSDHTSLARVGPLPAGWNASFDMVDDRPAQTWRQFSEPIVVNDGLVIRPAWRPVEAAEGVLQIEIEPGGSFGLGDHPTTRLSADATWRLAQRGDRVLDVGCGSGVLSIIAAHRGVAGVTAVDIAEAAREATVDNAQRNAVADRVQASTTPVGQIDGPFDLVLANILAPVLVSMAADLKRLTGSQGRLVLSGVLAGRHDHVLEALSPMRAVSTTELEGWAAVELEPG